MFRFVVANLSSVEAIFELINSAYRGDTSRKGWTFEADLVGGLRVDHAELESIIKKPGEYFLLCFDEENLLGCAHVVEENQGLYFGMISVRPELQNKKIGSALLEEIEARALGQGHHYLRLMVLHPRLELISYYERKGFVLTGEGEDFPTQYPAKVQGLRLLEMKKTL